MENAFNSAVNLFESQGKRQFNEGPFTTGHRVPKPQYNKYEESKVLENSVR